LRGAGGFEQVWNWIENQTADHADTRIKEARSLLAAFLAGAAPRKQRVANSKFGCAQGRAKTVNIAREVDHKPN
jgi:RNase adaptor protein for sRNA GlmZ degradation